MEKYENCFGKVLIDCKEQSLKGQHYCHRVNKVKASVYISMT